MDNKNLEQRLNRTSSRKFDWKSLLAIGVLLTGAYYAWEYGMNCTINNRYKPPVQEQERKEDEQKELEQNKKQSYFSLNYNN